MSKKRLEEIERLIAERNKHMGNDNDYSNADQYVHELSDKGHIDWLVDYAKEQAERVKELEQKVRVDSELFDKQVQQNKRYRNLLESLSKTRNIPAKIMKEQPDKKIIDANDILQYILRKINDELERETE